MQFRTESSRDRGFRRSNLAQNRTRFIGSKPVSIHPTSLETDLHTALGLAYLETDYRVPGKQC